MTTLCEAKRSLSLTECGWHMIKHGIRSHNIAALGQGVCKATPEQYSTRFGLAIFLADIMFASETDRLRLLIILYAIM